MNLQGFLRVLMRREKAFRYYESEGVSGSYDAF